jgi:hypothetical protein
MIYVINFSPNINKIMTTELKEHFSKDVKFSDIYSNFGGIRVSSTHPFAHLMNTEINGVTYDGNLFPSITIVGNHDQKNPQINIPAHIKDIRIKAAEIADITTNRERYIISDADLAALQSLTAGELYENAHGIQEERRSDFVIEIWAENDDVKGRIYDILVNFLIGYKRFTIKENYDIVIVEDSITGERDGNYNFDFGKMLYGSIVRFNIDYIVAQYYVDTDIVELGSVIHTEGEING